MTTLRESINTAQEIVENILKDLPEDCYLYVDTRYTSIAFGASKEYFAKYSISRNVLYCFHQSANVVKIHKLMKQYVDPNCEVCCEIV